MSACKNKNNYLISAISGASLLLGAATAVAQVGTMDYEPYIVIPVPVGGGVFMLVLGALLGLIAFWKISRSGFSGNKAVAVFLTMGAVVFSMSGGQVLHQAYAEQSNALSNPLGGTVDIYSGYQEYENTSGVLLRIDAINVDDCDAPPVAAAQAADAPLYPECAAVSGVLSQGGICTTNYPPCIENSRVTNRVGYYWVRADYRAPRGDHASVCAEFGLIATDYSVALTWDAALLEALSTDFGYLSNGDDNDSATSMWCWDGDGGPSTPGGYCETHNFGDFYVNYGYWGSDTDIRPVFTCTDSS